MNEVGSRLGARDKISETPYVVSCKGVARRVVKKVLALVLAGVILGWGYSWAAARFYHEDQTAGFWLGALHGGLMPAALPSLLVGRDVPIFAPNNSGRGYKLGYIAGINLCGLVFFGLAFRGAAVRSDQST
jgi:hypothetical protein